MRIFRRLVAFIVAFILVESFFTFLLEPVTFEHFIKYDIKEMKKNHDSAELAFFGDSRAIRTFKPDVFEQELSGVIEGCINEGVNQQHIVSTYYFMKDFLRHNDVKYAVVNLNYEYFLNTTIEPIEAKGLTFDRIQSISGMTEFVMKRFKVTEYPNILKSYRYRWQVKNIEDNLKRKTKSEYWRGIDTREDIHYVSKGYATWNLTYKQGNAGTPAGVQPWSESVVDDETLEYMDKIAQLCHDRNVKLIFVESPITIGRMYAIDGYEQFEQTVRSKCEELQVPYYNMNLLKEDNFSVDDTNFTDTEHMNEDGSTKASRILANIIKDGVKGIDTKKHFYTTFNEMNKKVAQIGACDLFVWDTDSEQEEIPWEQLKDCKNEPEKIILQGICYADKSIVTLYRFSISADGGKTYKLLQDYSTDNIYEIEKRTLSKNSYFRIDSKPQEGADLHHCFMERSIEE